jgi:hypothetical protein
MQNPPKVTAWRFGVDQRLKIGFIHIPILIAAVVTLVIATTVVVTGASPEPIRPFDYLCKIRPEATACKVKKWCPELATEGLKECPKPTFKPQPQPSSRPSPSPTPSPKSSPGTSPSASPSPVGSPTTYIDPTGKYKIIIPADWVVDGVTATTTYSTRKFTGPNGYVAITFGAGKDPIGGCSEVSNVELFDRTIAGCYLLQKDGSQILTRAYTKDKAGIDFTIEAYINAPLSYHRPVVLSVIKTIDIE